MLRTRYLIAITESCSFLQFLFQRYAEKTHIRSIPYCFDQTAPPETTNSRMISTSPSITELLFAVGLGDRLVGVTRFCNYPSETDAIAKIGGHYDVNYELAIALRPDPGGQ